MPRVVRGQLGHHLFEQVHHGCGGLPIPYGALVPRHDDLVHLQLRGHRAPEGDTAHRGHHVAVLDHPRPAHRRLRRPDPLFRQPRVSLHQRVLHPNAQGNDAHHHPVRGRALRHRRLHHAPVHEPGHHRPGGCSLVLGGGGLCARRLPLDARGGGGGSGQGGAHAEADGRAQTPRPRGSALLLAALRPLPLHRRAPPRGRGHVGGGPTKDGRNPDALPLPGLHGLRRQPPHPPGHQDHVLGDLQGGVHDEERGRGRGLSAALRQRDHGHAGPRVRALHVRLCHLSVGAPEPGASHDAKGLRREPARLRGDCAARRRR
mmetsp:Transcript_22937/g.67585  ORF Transcript_22937/g.67585 Transcript_22937/m.67585 type:complete len:317 (-) Transcript_22937:408-1358(-)